MSRILIVCVLFFGLSARAEEAEPIPVFGSHYGYTFDVAAEKNRRDVEMEMIEPLKDPPRPLREVLFNEKLSKEFQQQYQYRFGQTQAEQVINSPGYNNTDSLGYMYYSGKNVTLQDYRMYQRQFAEYMGRRLTEYHVDNWAKSSPEFRPVYTLKDRVSNLNVTVKKGYNVKWRYNFAGPTMDFNIENPYEVDFKVRVEMKGVLSAPTEEIYSLAYPLSQKVRMSALYRRVDGLYQLVFTRPVTKSISASLTGSMDTLDAGPTVKQNLVLVGLAWSD